MSETHRFPSPCSPSPCGSSSTWAIRVRQSSPVGQVACKPSNCLFHTSNVQVFTCCSTCQARNEARRSTYLRLFLQMSYGTSRKYLLFISWFKGLQTKVRLFIWVVACFNTFCTTCCSLTSSWMAKFTTVKVTWRTKSNKITQIKIAQSFSLIKLNKK